MSSQTELNSIMDLDFADFDSAWLFDQISASSNFLPNSDHLLSPFADITDDKSGAAGGIRITPDCRFLTCYPAPASENHKDEEEENDKKKLQHPINALARSEVPDMYVIKEKMTQALRYFKESTEHQILAQVWAPMKSGSKYVLSTSGQPFVLSPHSNGLHQYRTVSLMYSFSLDGENDGSLGLPGRVFRQKLPEWTPDVQYYSSKEYSRINHAKNYNVHGTLALPVFEPSGQSCVGVLELIMTSKKINYAPEVDKVCKALEAVNLRSSDILDQPNIQICNEGRQNALSEILEVLTETWVPCKHRSVLAYGGGLRKSCSSFDGSCMDQVCMSTTDVAFYVVDAHMWGFREACAEHHLQKGQGVVGRAFSSHGLCFCEAINRFSKMEYPLVHYAKMFGLGSSFAICLRSRYTGDDEYVLEFFLPVTLNDSMAQHTLLDSMLATMKQHFRSLMVASGRVLEEERKYMELVDVLWDGGPDLDIEQNVGFFPSKLPSMLETNDAVAPVDTCKKIMEEKDVNEGRNAAGDGEGCNGVSSPKAKEPKRPTERKRGKAEKQISLEVLQQYFAGSLKDAAKSLGVCPTTMKRICRQHGIPRWPSRKINKVNRSLSKLKRVIESVQGADGTFSLSSLSPTSVPVGVGSISWPANLNGASQQPSPTSNPVELSDQRNNLSTPRTLEKDWQAEPSNQEFNSRASGHEHNGLMRGFEVSRAGSGSQEASTGTSTSHGSCQGSPVIESTVQNSQFIPSFHEQMNNSMSSMFQPNRDMNLSTAFTLPDSLLKPFGSTLAEDASSSKDLRNLCSSTMDVNVEETIPQQGSSNPPFSCNHNTPHGLTTNPVNSLTLRFGSGQEMRSLTIKATFRQDIIRFRFALNSNIVELRDEVAKRFKINIGMFEMKYLDDDNEWVLIACDSDLQECLDIMRSSGSSLIRLSIHDMLGNPGSSCESSGG
ncbi:hypothetical protein V2J09_014602 [Rumex salicifolius]